MSRKKCRRDNAHKNRSYVEPRSLVGINATYSDMADCDVETSVDSNLRGRNNNLAHICRFDNTIKRHETDFNNRDGRYKDRRYDPWQITVDTRHNTPYRGHPDRT